MSIAIRLSDSKFVEVSLWCTEFTPEYKVSELEPMRIEWDDRSCPMNPSLVYELLTPKYQFDFANEDDALVFKLRWCDE